MLPHLLIALAAGAAYTLYIQDMNATAAAFDEPGVLKRRGHETHACPPHAKHLSHEFLGQLEVIRLRQVAHAKEPTTDARLNGVARVASSGLLSLGKKNLFVPQQ